MTIAIVFLYLYQRQQLYFDTKSVNRHFITQENKFITNEANSWLESLTTLDSNKTFKNFLAALDSKNSKSISFNTIELIKLFNNQGQYRPNHVKSLRFVAANGRELLALENGQLRKELNNISRSILYQQSIRAQSTKFSNTIFDKKNSLLHKSLLARHNGKVVGFLSITIDLKKLLNKYQYLFDAKIIDTLLIVNRQGRVLHQAVGEPNDKKELEQVFSIVKHASDKHPVVEYQQNVWSFIGNKSFDFYILFSTKGSQITAVLDKEYQKLAIAFGISSLIFVILIIRTASASMSAKRVVEEKKQFSNQKSLHFSSISDEIRPSINSVMGSLVTLQETKLSTKQAQYLETAKYSADCVLELLDEFQDYAKMAKGNLNLEKIEFNMRTTIRHITEQMSALAYKKGLEISHIVSADVPQRVVGDVTRIRQVLINLIGFAIKYTEKGEVSICLSAVDGFDNTIRDIYIDISDTGNVIDQAEVMDHFMLLSDTRYDQEEEYNSEGLGIALSKQMIELMSGELSVRTNNIGGNTFRVRLPMKVVSDVETLMPKANLQGERVLIVGEIETNRNALSAAFSKWGMSGAAMEEFPRVINVLRDAQIKGSTFDVCIIDVSLTSSSEKAFKVVTEIRGEYTEDELVVVILTAQGQPGDAKKSAELGAQAYLTKPVTRETMRETVRRILNNRTDKSKDIITRHSLKEDEAKNIQRIFLAEQNPDTQRDLVKLFSNKGFLVDVTNGGMKAENALRDNIYDLILLNTDIPNMNVYKFSKNFRNDESKFNEALSTSEQNQIHTPIIAIVNGDVAKVKDKCIKNGMDDVIQIPLDENQINHIIGQYLLQQQHVASA